MMNLYFTLFQYFSLFVGLNFSALHNKKIKNNTRSETGNSKSEESRAEVRWRNKCRMGVN